MTGRVTRLTVLGLGALVLAACADGPVVQPNEWTEGPGYRYRDLAVRGDGAGFRPVEKSGLAFVNVLSDAGIVQNRPRMNGSGVAVGRLVSLGLLVFHDLQQEIAVIRVVFQ